MKIFADENIPQVKEAFSSFGDVHLCNGREINNDILHDADVLLVRSITNVDSSLLNKTKIKFVGTATIGTDHIDKEYLARNNISFADAAGCNAFSVAEYVLCAIVNIYNKVYKQLKGKRIGIVGCGNVGSKVAMFSNLLGLKTIINDPPLERIYGKINFHTLDEALDADIITLHVPLNLNGIDKTHHLLNSHNLTKIKDDAILINSSRGAVIDNTALKNILIKNKKIKTVLDVWEVEPNISKELLTLTDISTAHIAGYSLEGKLNGTLFIYKKFCDFIGTSPEWYPLYPEVTNKIIDIDSSHSIENIIEKISAVIYDISSDSELLKHALQLPAEQIQKYFDKLRKDYKTRREFNNYTIKLSTPNDKLKKILEGLRFRVI